MKTNIWLVALLLFSAVTFSDEVILDAFTENFGGPKPNNRGAFIR